MLADNDSGGSIESFGGSLLLMEIAMNRRGTFYGLAFSVAAALAAAAAPEAAAEERASSGAIFRGTPRDIDFIKNLDWTQVILQRPAGSEQLIAHTKNDRIQSILLVALSMKNEVTVEYDDGESGVKRVISVRLTARAKSEPGHVVILGFQEEEGLCRAAIIGEESMKIDVWTKSAQMQSILETAVRQSIPVQELAFDAETKEITRGKVNVDLQD
jgi:hypothetical protein